MKITSSAVVVHGLANAENFGAALNQDDIPFPILGEAGKPVPTWTILRAGCEQLATARAGRKNPLNQMIKRSATAEGLRKAFGEDDTEDPKIDGERIADRIEGEMRANPDAVPDNDPNLTKLDASILVADWSDMMGADGPIPYSKDAVLAVLGFVGFRVNIPTEASANLSGMHYLTAREMEALSEKDQLGKLISHGKAEIVSFVGPLKHPDGTVMTTKVTKPGKKDKEGNAGPDIVTEPWLSDWLEDEVFRHASEIEKKRVSRVGRVQSDSSSGADGSPGT